MAQKSPPAQDAIVHGGVSEPPAGVPAYDAALASLKARLGYAPANDVAVAAPPEPDVVPTPSPVVAPVQARRRRPWARLAAFVLVGFTAILWWTQKSPEPAPPIEPEKPALVMMPTPIAEPAPAQGAAPQDASPPALTDARRRSLRRTLVQACEAQAYEAVLEPGRLLREHDGLDWRATLCFAEGLRQTGHREEAQAVYELFLARYPQNNFAPEARRILALLRGEAPKGAATEVSGL